MAGYFQHIWKMLEAKNGRIFSAYMENAGGQKWQDIFG